MLNSPPRKTKKSLIGRPSLDYSFLKKSENAVDPEVVIEVTEVVEFECMNLVDNLLLDNTHAKTASLEIIKQHKHVIFSDEPIIMEYEKWEEDYQKS